MTTSSVRKAAVQEQAVRLLKQLLANYRLEAVAAALGSEVHTVRRMLNGARAVSLADAINLARLGGISLDEHFGLQQKSASASAETADVQLGLSKVLSAIAEMLGGGAGELRAALEPTEKELIEHRRREPQSSAMVELLSQEALATLQRLISGEEIAAQPSRRKRSA